MAYEQASVPARQGGKLLRDVLTAIALCDPSAAGHTDPDTPEVAELYARRNTLIWVALGLAVEAGIPAGVGYDPNNLRPVVVYLHLPTGQVSWHLPAFDPGDVSTPAP